MDMMLPRETVNMFFVEILASIMSRLEGAGTRVEEFFEEDDMFVLKSWLRASLS